MSARALAALVRCRDEVRGIGPLLDMLRAQRVPVEIVVVDSGSRDGTLAEVRRRGVAPLQMEPREFGYGRALNVAAAAAGAELCVAISAHALPPDEDWASRCVEAMADPRVACAFGERVGPDLRPLPAPLLQDRAHAERHPSYGYSNSAGVFRRSLWERRPFAERLRASEDKEWAWHWLGEGMLVRLDPALAVHHSHADEGPVRAFARYRSSYAAEASFRPVPAPRVGDALTEWWRGPHGHRSALRARLDPRRAAALAGKHAGVRAGPRRLLAVSPLASLAGGEVTLLRLLPELVARGWRVTLAVPGEGPLREAATAAGLRTVRLPLGPPARRSAATLAGAALGLPPALRADVVLLNGLPTQRLVPLLRALRRPAVLHVNNPLPARPRAWERRGFFDVVRAVVVDSAHTRAECERAGAPGAQVIAPAAWDGAPPAPRSAGRPPGRVGFVGQLEPRKGVAELIEAAGAFLRDRPAARLTVVGSPPPGAEAYAARLRALAAASAVGDRIDFEGFAPGAARALGRFDLLAVPSLAEPFGTVAAEAAAAAVPVVASRVGGLREVVLHDETGVLVPAGEPAPLAEAVGALLDRPERLDSMGARARDLATRFAPSTYADAMESVLLRATGR